eukprot:10607091-Lingulodinium_polyedra.AAC.1
MDGGVVVSQRTWLRVCANTTTPPDALAELFRRASPQDARGALEVRDNQARMAAIVAGLKALLAGK